MPTRAEKMAELQDLTYENATHLLSCAHQLGHGRRIYTMRCHILKNMGDGRLKLLVFGRGEWKDEHYTSRYRYVESWRVQPRPALHTPDK